MSDDLTKGSFKYHNLFRASLKLQLRLNFTFFLNVLKGFPS